MATIEIFDGSMIVIRQPSVVPFPGRFPGLGGKPKKYKQPTAPRQATLATCINNGDTASRPYWPKLGVVDDLTYGGGVLVVAKVSEKQKPRMKTGLLSNSRARIPGTLAKQF
jgi:hypothetical protein